MNVRTYKRKRPEVQLIEDVQNLCRLCLEKSDDMIAIFVDDLDGIAKLSLRIMMCIGLEITKEESLSNVICSNCHQELDRYYKFKKKCEISYQQLKFYLKSLPSKNSEIKAIEEHNIQQEKIMQVFINCHESSCLSL